MAKLSIIVPTYNEVENLPLLVDRIHSCLCQFDYELIVVDDNSPDGTGALAEELAHEKPIKVVHREGKQGLASAVIDGFKHASGDVLGVIDADLQHPPEHIPELFQAIDGADIIIASRYVDGGGVEGWTLTRELISRGAKFAPRFLFAKIRPVKDPLSGFFLFRKKVIENIELTPVGYKILLEILVRGNHNGVTEVPYIFQGRVRGTSTFNTTEQVNYLKHLWRLIRAEKEIERFFKFCVVGASGIIVNEGAYWLLTRPIGIKDVVAGILSIELSILSNFLLNDIWTFRDRRETGSILTRALKFNLTCGAGAALNYGVFVLLAKAVGLHDMISMLIGIGIAMLFNFFFSKWWTWR